MEQDRSEEEQTEEGLQISDQGPLRPGLQGADMPPVRFGFLAGLGVTMFSMLGAVILALPFRAMENSAAFRIVLGLSQIGLLLLPTIFLARAQSLPFRELFRLRRVPFQTYPAMIVGIVALLPIIQCYQIAQEIFLIPPEWKHYYLQMDRQNQQALTQLFSSHTPWGLALSLAVGALAPAISEEFLFRGLVQRSFERQLRPGLAIALAGAIFGMMHFQPTNFVVLSSLGLFFGYAAWSMRSIYPTILAHALFNTFAIVQLYLSGEATGDRVGRFTPSDFYDLLPIALFSLAIFLLVIFWLRQQRLRCLADDALAASRQEPAIHTPNVIE